MNSFSFKDNRAAILFNLNLNNEQCFYVFYMIDSYSLKDANGLYSYCLKQKMPVGWYFRRKAANKFQLEQGGKGRQSSRAAYDFLTFMELEHNTRIIHEFSSGYEYRIGARKLAVDGYVPAKNLILEFQG